MEGYANVDSSHEDFDDLDIEGRNARSEEHSGEEDSLERKVEHGLSMFGENVKLELGDGANDLFAEVQRRTAFIMEAANVERRLLSLKVKVDDNTYGYVFSLKTSNGVSRWKCHLCDVLIVGKWHVDTHIQSKKHQLKLALPLHPRYIFGRIESSQPEKHAEEMPKLAPGEPVPPGFEDVVKRVAQIQTILDSYKRTPLIGLEYLVELTPDERGKEPLYVCMLCDKKGDPRVAMAHITSFNHCSKYIGIQFPTASKIINTEYPRTKYGKKVIHIAMTHLCSKIEERYGRLQPVVVDKDLFEQNKDEIRKQIEADKHFRETPSALFVEHVSKDVIESLLGSDDVQLPADEKPTAEDQESTFIKGKITCDRSRLRTRNSEDVEEEDVFKKLAELEKKAAESMKAEGKSSVESGIKEKKPDKVEFDKKSLSSVSTISSSSLSPSRSRSRSSSRSRSHSRHDYRKYDKYRRTGYSRRPRSRSWSGSRRSRSRNRRSRSRSRDSKGRRWHQRSRSPQRRRRSPNREGRSKYQEKRKEESIEDSLRHERSKWARFRSEADRIEREMAKELKYHEKNPEKHPLYPDEWKKFWNRRYKELQAENKDPSKHDFKPEWIEFWNKRMKELYEEEIRVKKEQWKVKLELPSEWPKFHPKKNPPAVADDDVIVISPSSGNEKNDKIKKDVTVADIKNTWKALTGSDIKDSAKRSPSPWEDQEPSRDSISGRLSPRPGRWWQEHPNKLGHGGGRDRLGRSRHLFNEGFRGDSTNVVTVLRLLTAMENQLGSLGPRINTLLAKALALERTTPGYSQSLLDDSEIVVLFETVREKLKGQLFAGIVPRAMVLATRSCIHNLSNLLTSLETSAPKTRPATSLGRESKMITEDSTDIGPVSLTGIEPAAPVVPMTEPVAVPGVGVVDKVAIAQQIAAALVAQGKTDVSQEELQQLINAVVGMAQASAGSHEPISAAAFLAQQKQNAKQDDSKLPPGAKVSDTPEKHEETPFQMLLSTVTSRSSTTGPLNTKSDMLNEPRVSGLQLLQSAYEDKHISPGHSMVSKPLFPIHQSPGGRVQERPGKSNLLSHIKRSENMDDLSEEELKSLLQNFKDLSPDEQQCLITYLKTIEERDPDRVERLRKYVNLGQSEMNTVKSSINSPPHSSRSDDMGSGRLSPFSLRLGGINPSQDDRGKREKLEETDISLRKGAPENSTKMDDSDDDYSFEDIYAAASRKVKEREKAKEAEELAKMQVNDTNKKVEDSKTILRETKEIIANLMGQLPGKFIQKQSPRIDSPAHPTLKVSPVQDSLNTSKQISTVGSGNTSSESGQPVPTLDSSTRQRPLQTHQYQQQQFGNYDTNSSYSNQYGGQGSYPAGPGGYQQGIQNYSTTTTTAGSYGGGFNNYYNNQPHYPQQIQVYPNSYNDPSYPDQYNQPSFQQHGGGMHNQFPNQPSGYY